VLAGRPQAGQNFQPNSSSDPQAGQFVVVRFCPQCGQNVIGRPAGSTSPHARQRSSRFGTSVRDPTVGTAGFDARGVAGIDWTGTLGRVALAAGAGAGGAAGCGGAGAGGGDAGGADGCGAFAPAGGAAEPPAAIAGSSPRPTAKLLSADDEIATLAVSNCLNAVGSGFTEASSARSASRIGSSTIK
jgi:hypothetical protein